MTSSQLYPNEISDVFDSIVEGMDSLFVIRTQQVEKLAEQLATYQSYTGRAAYRWHNNSGIKRFDLRHIVLPKTRELFEAIYHVGNSPHFGIYLFTGFESQLLAPISNNVLEHFLQSVKEQRKFIIFADPNPMIPRDLVDKFQNLRIRSLDLENNPQIRTSYLYS